MDNRLQRKAHLKFCIFNANSINRKKTEVNEFIEKHKIDVVFATETHLRTTQTFKLRNMACHRNDRQNRRGGGTAIFLRKNLIYNPEETPPLTSLEATIVTIETSYGKTALVAAYLRPKAILDEQDFLTIFDSYDRVLFCGDINAKHASWNSRRTNQRGIRLFDLEARLNAVITAPEDPTHIPYVAHHRPDVLDVAIVKNIDPDLHLKSINDLSSNHLPVIGFLNNAVEALRYDSKTMIDWTQFERWLNNNVRPTIDLTTKEKVDEAIATLSDKIATAYKKASTKILFEDSNVSELPAMLQDIKYLKNRARRRWQLFRNPEDRREMNRLSRELRKRAQEWRAEIWEDRMDALQLQSREDWKLVRHLRNPSQHRNALLRNNDLIFDALRQAEYYADTYEEQNTLVLEEQHREDYNEEELIRRAAQQFRDAPLSDRPELTTPQEVKQIIRKLGIHSAPGPDKITNEQLKHLPRKPLVLLTRIFNSCLQQQYYPSAWKICKIVPIPKRGKDLKKPENYRPISLLPTMSKVLERVLLPRIRQPLLDDHIIRPEQFAYQPYLSAELQLLRITEFITKNMNYSRYTAAVFLDVEKAYDKVWKDNLMVKLHNNTNIPDCYLKLVDSYLQNRKFFVQIDGKRSGTKTLEQGIPQGSVLSPTLFTIYVNDIPTNGHTLLAQFADDTALLTTSRRLDTTIRRMQEQIHLTETWAKRNKIKINAEKTKAILFTRRRPVLDMRLEIGGIPVAWTDRIKYLGVTLDKGMYFKHHIEEKKLKISKTIHMLYPMLASKEMKHRTKLRLYLATIQPMMLYGCPSWGITSKTNVQILQRLQNRCLKLILNAPWWTSTALVHNELGIPYVDQQIKEKMRKLIEKLDMLRPNATHLREVGIVAPARWHKVRVPLSIISD